MAVINNLYRSYTERRFGWSLRGVARNEPQTKTASENSANSLRHKAQEKHEKLFSLLFFLLWVYFY